MSRHGVDLSLFEDDETPLLRDDWAGEWIIVITRTDRHTQHAKFKPTKAVICFIHGGKGKEEGLRGFRGKREMKLGNRELCLVRSRNSARDGQGGERYGRSRFWRNLLLGINFAESRTDRQQPSVKNTSGLTLLLSYPCLSTLWWTHPPSTCSSFGLLSEIQRSKEGAKQTSNNL